MKGLFYGLRGKEISLILIVLTCTTILIWAWDRTPLLATFLPPKNRLLQLPQDILSGGPPTRSTPIDSEIHVNKEIATFPENETVYHQEGRPFNIAAPTDPESVPAPAQKKEIPPGVADKEAKQEQTFEAEKSSTAENPTILTESEGYNNLTSGKKKLEQERSAGIVSPADFANISSSARGKGDKNFTYQACNYAKGKWVVEDSRPWYSGSTCKQWLSSMWACQLMQRKDFAYEKLRWQPKDCELEEFEAAKFFRSEKNPSTWRDKGKNLVNGDWNTGGSCDNTTPMSIGKEVLQDESSDYSAPMRD
ncbi:hypothetical protein Q3G72_011648 [Acer saccharum]|nr:hypothetical protein Q3G72_011648 [Acer saccharum]